MNLKSLFQVFIQLTLGNDRLLMTKEYNKFCEFTNHLKFGIYNSILFNGSKNSMAFIPKIFKFHEFSTIWKDSYIWSVDQKWVHLQWRENIQLLVLYFELTSKFNFSQILQFNATKFCLNKFDFKFASIFDSTLVLKLVEVNLMGAKGLLN